MFRQSLRQFSTTLTRSNIIADLYVKELKAFKPTPLTNADAESATKAWKLPSAAKIPAIEGEGADALAAYESAPVDVTTSSADGNVVAEEYKPDDWFVFPVDEEPGHHAH
ncbi:F1F0 ATP synthase subunit H [Pichia kluyveri]|uniref:F1F0 ATP synthase subunit H n=1 Tax=Pichia kluyveri TaxID=36015 RepID=A0AAV5QZB4_PICKL|nr:F1F0 ATP synthase subunit H [Pichia kluyveri]